VSASVHGESQTPSAPRRKQNYFEFLAASAGIALAIGLLAGCRERQPEQADATEAPSAQADATLGAATRYRLTFHWNGPAAPVDVHLSADGLAWQRICNGLPAATGSNTIHILISTEILRAASAPRLRIGTADRKRGFETPIKL
jgi:hypothetical protein